MTGSEGRWFSGDPGKAWAGTFAMANPLMEGIFRYADRGRMLVFGSLFYALYFIVSFPLFLSIDERKDGAWDPSRAALGGLAAGMLTLLLLDLATRLVGAIT
jgi:cycloeucalenol cycloisomerase